MPNSCSLSMPLAAGSISSKTARSMVESDISQLLRLSINLAQSRDLSFADLAQQMAFLPFLYLPNRNQRDQPRGQHVEQEEEGESTDGQYDLDPRHVDPPRERHAVDRQRFGDDDVTFEPHTDIDQKTHNRHQPRGAAPFLIPQQRPRHHDITE